MMTKKTKRNPIDVSYDLNTIIDSLRTLAKVSYASGTDGRSSYGVLEPTPDDVLLLVSDSLFSMPSASPPYLSSWKRCPTPPRRAKEMPSKPLYHGKRP